MRMCRRGRMGAAHRAGFTLVEALLATAIVGLIMGLLGWVTIDSGRMGQYLWASVSQQNAARFRLDTFIGDVHASSGVVATWTASDGTVYTSHATNDTASPPTYLATLILKTPSYDTNGNIWSVFDPATNTMKIDPSHYDYIVYHLAGAGPTYTLNRLVQVSAGSARPASADTVVATNVQSVNFTCVVDEPLTGDGTVSPPPLHGVIPATTADTLQIVTVDGTNLAVGTNASNPMDVYFSPAPNPNPNNVSGELVFTTAPTIGKPIDVLFTVDPATTDPTLITGAALDLKLITNDPSLPVPEQSLVSELSGRTNLDNWNGQP